MQLAPGYLVLLGLASLTVGAECLIRGAVRLAVRFGLSSFFIGLTIVGFGTSMPELAASVVAALRDQTGLSVGNVIGSNIFNIALILGLTALLRPIPVQTQLVRKEVWVVIVVSLVPWATYCTNQVAGRGMGMLLLAGLGLYLVQGYRVGRRTASGATPPAEGYPCAVPGALLVPVGLTVVGILMLVLGARWLVDGSSALARRAGVSDLVIGLTIVAAGTSMPELVTSAVATLRRQADLAVGNVLGSNVFNLLGILGVACVLRPQRLAPQVLRLDTPVMVAASVALLPIVLTGARISRSEGVVLLLGYALYVGVLFTWAPQWFGS